MEQQTPDDSLLQVSPREKPVRHRLGDERAWCFPLVFLNQNRTAFWTIAQAAFTKKTFPLERRMDLGDILLLKHELRKFWGGGGGVFCFGHLTPDNFGGFGVNIKWTTHHICRLNMFVWFCYILHYAELFLYKLFKSYLCKV